MNEKLHKKEFYFHRSLSSHIYLNNITLKSIQKILVRQLQRSISPYWLDPIHPILKKSKINYFTDTIEKKILTYNEEEEQRIWKQMMKILRIYTLLIIEHLSSKLTKKYYIFWVSILKLLKVNKIYLLYPKNCLLSSYFQKERNLLGHLWLV